MSRPDDPVRVQLLLQTVRRRHCSWLHLTAEKSQARANCSLTAFAADPEIVWAMVDLTVTGYQQAH